MSNEVVNWESKLAEYAKQDAERVTPSNSVISFKAGVVTYAGQPAPDNKIRVIVIGSAHERAWYEDSYDPDNIAIPKCWGLAADDVTAPHHSVEDPQAASCAACPMNRWGSADRGKGKACKERVRLALIPANVAVGNGDAILKAEVALARIPVTSVKNWSNYVSMVASTKKRPTFAVVTELSAKPDPRFQFQVTFDYVSDVDVQFLPQLDEKRQIAQDVLLKPFEARQEAEPAPAAKGGKHKV
jgi:hypothetical protein